MIAGIVIDPWKLTIFKRHLNEGFWEYTTEPGPDGTIVIRISYDKDLTEIASLVLAAQKECAGKICPTCED